MKYYLLIALLLFSGACNKKTSPVSTGATTPPPDTIVDITTVVKQAPDPLDSIRQICIMGFKYCTNIQNGYYTADFTQEDIIRMNEICTSFSRGGFGVHYAPVSDIDPNSRKALRYNVYGRCIETLKWPVDSVVKYLGLPYEMLARYDPKDPEKQIGTYLYYCQKWRRYNDSIDCSGLQGLWRDGRRKRGRKYRVYVPLFE